MTTTEHWCQACRAHQHHRCAHWLGYDCACDTSASCGMKDPRKDDWFPEPLEVWDERERERERLRVEGLT